MTWEQFKARLVANLTSLHKKAVFWVSAFWTIATGWWTVALTDADRAMYYADMPILRYVGSIIALTVVAARVWPQTPTGVVTVTYANGTVATGPAGAPALPVEPPESSATAASPDPRDPSYRG